MATSIHCEKETVSPHVPVTSILILNTSICNLTYRPDNGLSFMQTCSRSDKKTVSIEAVLAGNISLSRVRKHSQMFLTKKLNTNYREEASN